MAVIASSVERRTLSLLAGQTSLAQTAWTMASPSIVITFLAVSVGMPVFLVGALVSVRQLASSLTDIFLFERIAKVKNRKLALSLCDMILALCFGATIVSVLFGTQTQTSIVFVVCIFTMGVADEFQHLLMTDFLADNLQSKSRLLLQYTQMAIGGGFGVALAWIAHELTLELPPLSRHSIVVTIGIACFALSALAILAVEDSAPTNAARPSATRSPLRLVRNYYLNVLAMMKQSWFRQYVVITTVFSAVILAVPFFALIAAETHHTTSKGLTAMVTSYALGYIVAGPLWGTLNNVSHRLVMITCSLLVGFCGSILATLHMLNLQHDLRIHAIAIFVVTVAVRGIIAVLQVYFMEIAPKGQRVKGIAVARSFGRLTMICLSALLAAVAHLQETVWAIFFIAFVSFATATISYFFARKFEK
ncbi:Major Facilitator Superfamily protein [Labrenzia sp. THAF82]|nr:Major Facilitator Superfamily protein [Labrenzia sp. THAF82]